MISNLVSLNPAQKTYSSLSPQPKKYNSLGQPSPLASAVPNNATSTVTGKATAGSITGALPAPVKKAPVQPIATAQVNTGYTPTPGQLTGTQSAGGSDSGLAAKQQVVPEAPKPRGLFQDVVSSLASRGSQPSQLTMDARKSYDESVNRLAQYQTNLADTYAENRMNPIAMRFKQGREAAIQQANASKLAALQGAVQQQQTAIGQGIQQQGVEQSALASAAGLAPEATRFEAFGGTQLAPQNRAQELAQQVKSGLISPQAAEAQMSSLYGGAGATFLNQALQGSGYNYIAGGAQAAAQGSNIQQAGTAGTDIARTGLAQTTNEYMNMTSAAQYAGTQAQRVSTILDKAGLNNTASTDYNKVVNELKARFSSQDFTALDTALREAQQAYATLLSTGGGTPSGREAQSLAVLDISKSSNAINAAIRELDAAVANRLTSKYQVMQQYEQNLGGGTTYGGAGGAPASTGSGGGITWDNIGD